MPHFTCQWVIWPMLHVGDWSAARNVDYYLHHFVNLRNQFESNSMNKMEMSVENKSFVSLILINWTMKKHLNWTSFSIPISCENNSLETASTVMNYQLYPFLMHEINWRCSLSPTWIWIHSSCCGEYFLVTFYHNPWYMSCIRWCCECVVDGSVTSVKWLLKCGHCDSDL